MRPTLALLLAVSTSACGGSAGSGDDGGGDGGWGTPELTFTLPVPAGDRPALYFPDLVTRFPEVDWSKLDRLYIPAGVYRTIYLKGLPRRSASRPLVITNRGGQVRVGGLAGNYVFVVGGGRNWVLTGRYDEAAGTGAAAFPGHAGGAYAHSQGTYGIVIDDAFSKAGLSGLAVGGGASDFELDMLEITRAEFAGLVVKTDDDGAATMRNVRIHDLYVHDVGSEGIYLGSTQAQPQHAFEGLRLHDNRLLRTGTEALQVGQLGADCEIDHNVIDPGAVRWRSAFQQWQDGNVQYGQRYGSSRFHHNVVIGTGDLFVELFPTLAAGDPRRDGDAVTFSDNYFADTSLSGVYTHAADTGMAIRFERNVFRGFRFNYREVYPDTATPSRVFTVGAGSKLPHTLVDNVVDGPYPFLASPPAVVRASNNTTATVARVQFRDFMGAALDEDYRKLEWWTARATRVPDPAPKPAVVYPAGARVLQGGVIYEALVQNQETEPATHPAVWKALPAPADDVRLAPGSPHAGLGIR